MMNNLILNALQNVILDARIAVSIVINSIDVSFMRDVNIHLVWNCCYKKYNKKTKKTKNQIEKPRAERGSLWGRKLIGNLLKHNQHLRQKITKSSLPSKAVFSQDEKTGVNPWRQKNHKRERRKIGLKHWFWIWCNINCEFKPWTGQY